MHSNRCGKAITCRAFPMLATWKHQEVSRESAIQGSNLVNMALGCENQGSCNARTIANQTVYVFLYSCHAHDHAQSLHISISLSQLFETSLCPWILGWYMSCANRLWGGITGSVWVDVGPASSSQDWGSSSPGHKSLFSAIHDSRPSQ